MLAQLGFEECPNCRNGSGAVVKHRPCVDKPQGVKRHRMPSLKTKPITPAENPRLGRPRKGSLLDSDRLWEGVEVAKVPPETLRQRTRKKEVTHSLNLTGTVVTEGLFRNEMTNPIAKRQGVEEKFVKRLLVPWRTRTVVKTRPNVRRRATNLFCDASVPPVVRAEKTLALVEIPTSQSSSKGEEHDARHLDVCVESGPSAPGWW